MRTLLFTLLLATSPAWGGEKLVCYTASWCGPCRQFKADLASDQTIAAGREVVIVDVDQDRQAARRAKVRSMPTFILVEDGGEKARRVGYDGPEALKAWVIAQ